MTENFETLAEDPEQLEEFRGMQEEVVYFDDASMKEMMAGRDKMNKGRGTQGGERVENIPEREDEHPEYSPPKVKITVEEKPPSPPKEGFHGEEPYQGDPWGERNSLGGKDDGVKAKEGYSKVVNSQIISASVLNQTGEGEEMTHVHLDEPVIYTLEHKTVSVEGAGGVGVISMCDLGLYVGPVKKNVVCFDFVVQRNMFCWYHVYRVSRSATFIN